MINTYDFHVEHPEIFKQLAVKSMLFLYYRCPQVENKMHLYTHYNQILFTLSGKKIIHHRNRSWLLTENTSLFIRKTAFDQEMFYKAGWEILAFYFQDDFLIRVFNEFRANLPLKPAQSPPTDMLIEIHVNPAMRAFFYSIVPYFSQQPAPSEDLLELKFKELVFLILSNPENAALLAHVRNLAENGKVPLRDVMEANYTFNLSLSDYARITQRSLAAFKREFEEVYHTSPGKWLTRKKLEYAQLLLTITAKNVNEIASDSGFENASHFNRIFKERFGLPPLQYRKKMQATGELTAAV